MHPSGARKKRLAHAIFSKDGPNLNRPDVTKSPNVTPNIYKAVSKNIREGPIVKIETPKRGIATKVAGIKPIKVLMMAVNVKDAIISLNLIGAINKFVKFLLQISSKNIIL
tara:strand:+ start:395 stop:727 length:333 start_codon:yes stop_codon:yes gene_type:complete